ncbi:MAG: ABC transporter ATP-binding protein [Clostridium sp.]
MEIKDGKYGFLDIIKIPFKCNKVVTSINIILNLFYGILPTLQIIVVANFIDKALYILKNNRSIVEITMPLLMLMGIVAYNNLHETLKNFTKVKIENSLREKFKGETVKRRGELSYKNIEDEKAWEVISRVCKEPEKSILKGFSSIQVAISLIISILGVVWILISEAWWAGMIIIVVSVPLTIIAIKSGKASYEARVEGTKSERVAAYVETVLQERDYVEERTLFQYEKGINKKYFDEYEKARKIRVKTSAKWFVKMKITSVISSFVIILILIILANPLIRGMISVGMFISLTNGIQEIIDKLSWTLTSVITSLTETKEYLSDVNRFLELEVEKGALDTPVEYTGDFKELEFVKVRFKYPNTDKYVLNGVSFKINNGFHYAFVGGNGEGKTTITKLITGLFKEYEGEILIDGRNLKDFNEDEIKGLSSVVYQDFSKYYLTIEENVGLGDVNKYNEGNNLIEINNALEIMDLNEDFKEYPNGTKTVVGKIKEGGIDLSGGQWQKLAMARGIVKKAPLRILDEPTAALDPVSESNIYERFEAISKNKTTIFISHRLGSTMLADKIFVIANGIIKEEGSHKELMEAKGEYFNMYETQKGWYE